MTFRKAKWNFNTVPWPCFVYFELWLEMTRMWFWRRQVFDIKQLVRKINIFKLCDNEICSCSLGLICVFSNSLRLWHLSFVVLFMPPLTLCLVQCFPNFSHLSIFMILPWLENHPYYLYVWHFNLVWHNILSNICF